MKQTSLCLFTVMLFVLGTFTTVVTADHESHESEYALGTPSFMSNGLLPYDVGGVLFIPLPDPTRPTLVEVQDDTIDDEIIFRWSCRDENKQSTALAGMAKGSTVVNRAADGDCATLSVNVRPPATTGTIRMAALHVDEPGPGPYVETLTWEGHIECGVHAGVLFSSGIDCPASWAATGLATGQPQDTQNHIRITRDLETIIGTLRWEPGNQTQGPLEVALGRDPLTDLRFQDWNPVHFRLGAADLEELWEEDEQDVSLRLFVRAGEIAAAMDQPFTLELEVHYGDPAPETAPAGILVNGEPVHAIRYDVPKKELMELEIDSSEPFKVERLSTFGANAVTMIRPMGPLDKIDTACAATPQDWTIITPEGEQTPNHPPGKYLMRTASDRESEFTMEFYPSQLPYFAPEAQDVGLQPTGHMAFIEQSHDPQQESGLPIRYSYDETAPTPSFSLVANSFSASPRLGAGEHAVEVEIRVGEDVCAQAEGQNISATIGSTAVNKADAYATSLVMEDKVVDFSGHYENTAGVWNLDHSPWEDHHEAWLIMLPLD